MRETLGVLILAAGKGTRMHSDRPKVMQHMLEEPMLRYVMDALDPLAGAGMWTVIGHGADQVRAHFADGPSAFVVQAEQLGTGHAVATAWQDIAAAGCTHVLVVNGDTPQISREAMTSFVDEALEHDADLAFLTVQLDDAGAFGRVVRDSNDHVTAIIEAKDFDEATHGICTGEINAGIYCLRAASVGPLLSLLGNDNRSGEYYITDLVSLAVARSLKVRAVRGGNDPSLLGVNTPQELMLAEEAIRAAAVNRALASGAMIHAPDLVRIGPKARVEPGAEITGPCEIYGHSRIDRGARIASHVWMRDTAVAAGAEVRSFCHLDGADVGPSCAVGPFTRMRPGTVLEEAAHAGSFVEIKKSVLRRGAKANHLAYIGDADIGAASNIGAGVITCNYDGENKHATVVGSDAFIGSNSSLVAPVSVGDGAFVGAGSVITRDVPSGHLGIGRARQVNKDFLPRRRKA